MFSSFHSELDQYLMLMFEFLVGRQLTIPGIHFDVMWIRMKTQIMQINTMASACLSLVCRVEQQTNEMNNRISYEID